VLLLALPACRTLPEDNGSREASTTSRGASALDTEVRNGIVLRIEQSLVRSGEVDGQPLVVVRVGIRNASGRLLRIEHGGFHLVDLEGASYPAISPDLLGPRSEDPVLPELALAQGEDISGYVHFELPSEAPRRLSLHATFDDATSGELAAVFVIPFALSGS
jgi:hypothetical protein